MKNKTLKYLLLSAVIALSLSFTACSKEPEPVNQSAETIAEETTTEESTEETTDEISDESAEKTTEESTEESTAEPAEGIAAEEPAATTETSDDTSDDSFIEYGKNDASLEGYEVTIAEVLDTQMYAIKGTDLYKLDNEKAGKINIIEYGVCVTATGKTSNGWYEVLWGTTKGYLPADVLSTENPLPPVDMNEVNPETGKTTQENLDKFYEAMQDPALDDIIGPAPSEPIPDGGVIGDIYTPEDNEW